LDVYKLSWPTQYFSLASHDWAEFFGVFGFKCKFKNKACLIKIKLN